MRRGDREMFDSLVMSFKEPNVCVHVDFRKTPGSFQLRVM